MKNFIKIEKIWQDDDFFEVEIICSSEIITASTRVYITEESIDSLSSQIKKFFSGIIGTCFWENGEKGDGTTTYISLEISKKDKFGHILIEVYMELNDGGDFSKHNCCFYIETELGLLDRFNSNLATLKEPQIGIQVVLN